MSISIRISLNEQLYLRDPQDTKLGRRIIQYGIQLIDELGFESFTFKKLAQRIESTEASIYRYFENKHLLLIYLVSWYWEWLSFQIDLNTNNMSDPKRKMGTIIQTLIQSSNDSNQIDYVDEESLRHIVIAEGIKAIHTKDVDAENTMGLFSSYKDLIDKISTIIMEIKPEFEYPNALSSTLLDLSMNHIFFAEHLPKLTDVKITDNNYSEVETMIKYFTVKIMDL